MQDIDNAIDVQVLQVMQVLAARAMQKTAEVPQSQFTDTVMGIPVVQQRQMPTVQTVLKTGDPAGAAGRQRRLPMNKEVAEVQVTEMVVDVTTAKQRQIPTIQTPQRMLEVPQVREQTVAVARLIPQERVSPVKETWSLRERAETLRDGVGREEHGDCCSFLATRPG